MCLVLRIAILSDAGWFGWLVKGLKIEDVETPVDHAADTLAPESRRICCARNSILIVGATYESRSQHIIELDKRRHGNNTVRWPSRLTSPKLDIVL